MAPPVELFTPRDLQIKAQTTLAGKKRKNFDGELGGCEKFEMVQYECLVEKKGLGGKRTGKDGDAVVKCWPVERFFRRLVLLVLEGVRCDDGGDGGDKSKSFITRTSPVSSIYCHDTTYNSLFHLIPPFPFLPLFPLPQNPITHPLPIPSITTPQTNDLHPSCRDRNGTFSVETTAWEGRDRASGR
jgi:hypothetical protein